MKTPNAEFIESLDSCLYDVEAAKIDDSNGNFSPDCADDYLMENIVIESLINGQFAQAQTQCRKYWLNYDEMRSKAGMEPFIN